MLSAVKRQIFAHDFLNPPGVDTSCDVTLKIVNSKGRIDLTKEKVNFQTQYLLLILDPSSLGLSSSEQNIVDSFTENLLLAANLLLQRAALMTLGGGLIQSQVEFKQPEHRVVVEDRPEGKHITITEVIMLRDTIHITIGFSEEIDEDKLVSHLELINKVNEADIDTVSGDTKIKLSNLKKSLNEYKNAMSVFDRLMIFKHLFNSLELATNWDGVDRKGSDLDNEVVKISMLQTSEMCNWREFYNRTKHIDRTPIDLRTFITGIESLPSFLKPIRLAVETMIIDRLKLL